MTASTTASATVTFTDTRPSQVQDLLAFADQKWQLGKSAQEINTLSSNIITRAIKAHTKLRSVAKDDKESSKPSAVVLASPHSTITGQMVVSQLPQAAKEESYASLGGDLSLHFVVMGSKNERHVFIDFDDLILGEDKAGGDHAACVCALVSGVLLRCYRFDQYLTSDEQKNGKLSVVVKAEKLDAIVPLWKHYAAQIAGATTAKNLASEPGNILYPKEYAERIVHLAKEEGLKVDILDHDRLEKEGFHALLAVAKGSVNPARVAVIEWNNGKSDQQPLVFIGKGVTFDTGGISLKPPRNMGDMKYDMSGSAVVVGLMQTLAQRKAPVNAVGIVGLVENMPDGGAMRPGDIISSYAGKTIDVQNTDAEGRLVLVDLLAYAQKRYKPKFMIDLATLTGAIVVSLADVYGGVMSNNDALCQQLDKAGVSSGEMVWRMPLHQQIDVLMRSKVADVCNIETQNLGAQSSSAGHFLERFVDSDIPWAHLDIAGVAWRSRAFGVHGVGPSGWGVRLLDQLVQQHYQQ